MTTLIGDEFDAAAKSLASSLARCSLLAWKAGMMEEMAAAMI